MIIQRTETVDSAYIKRLDTCNICDETFPVEIDDPVTYIFPRCKESLKRVIKMEQTKEVVVPKDEVAKFVKSTFPNFPVPKGGSNEED